MKKKAGIVIISLSLLLGSYKAIASIPDNLPLRPNIVFIMVDDLGWGDLKAYNPNSKIIVPSIDQLASEGRVFFDAHTPAAACAPSRYSIMTGNYTWRGRDEWGTWNYFGFGSQILQNQWTTGDILKQAGYTTGIIGKYHLGGNAYSLNTGDVAFWNDPENTLDFSRPILDGPDNHGFDYSYLNLSGVQASPYAFFENNMLVGNVSDLIEWVPGQYGDSVIEKGGIGVSTWDTTDIERSSLEKAVQFIRQSNAAVPNAPFFLYLPLAAIHSPHTPPAELDGVPVRGASGISDKGDMIHAVDIVVGKLLATLEEEGILDETLIVFTSDNGALTPVGELNSGHDGAGGLRGNKTLIFEGGHRVPLIVKWGDGTQLGSFIPPGSTSDTLIGVQDFAAILAQLAGVDLPSNQAHDSFNMTSALFANINEEHLRRDYLLTISNRDFNSVALPRNEFYYALREGEWKLIVHYKQSDPNDVVPLGLYDLSIDLKETTNLVNNSAQSDRVQAMVDRFKHLHEISRTAPIFIFDIDGDTVADDIDNCKFNFNIDQQNTDTDNFGDACDAFLLDSNEWLDTDSDGIGNNADTDDDNDGLLDIQENNIGTSSLLRDTDGDGFSDGAEMATGTDPLNQASHQMLADGDLNLDGVFNAGDLLLSQQVILGVRLLTPAELLHVDVAPRIGGSQAADGQFSLGDLVVLQQFLLRETTFSQ